MKKTTTNKLSEANKRFWALPANKQRVAVAKDVIKQIEVGFLQPEAGTYFVIDAEKDFKTENQLDVLFKKLKRSKAAKCQACGIGGIFLGLVNLGNDMKTKEAGINYDIEQDVFCSINDSKMRNKLRKVFSSDQLALIECAFEKANGFLDNHKSDIDFGEREEARMFGRQYPEDSDRLIAIMKNIIENDGDFKP